MDSFAGLDASLETVDLCIVDGDGLQIEYGMVRAEDLPRAESGAPAPSATDDDGLAKFAVIHVGASSSQTPGADEQDDSAALSDKIGRS